MGWLVLCLCSFGDHVSNPVVIPDEKRFLNWRASYHSDNAIFVSVGLALIHGHEQSFGQREWLGDVRYRLRLEWTVTSRISKTWTDQNGQVVTGWFQCLSGLCLGGNFAILVPSFAQHGQALLKLRSLYSKGLDYKRELCQLHMQYRGPWEGEAEGRTCTVSVGDPPPHLPEAHWMFFGSGWGLLVQVQCAHVIRVSGWTKRSGFARPCSRLRVTSCCFGAQIHREWILGLWS